MNIVDSSGWREYLSGVRMRIIFQLHFKILLSSMADSLIYATATIFKCIVWTQDSDFENLPGVKFFPKNSAVQQGH